MRPLPPVRTHRRFAIQRTTLLASPAAPGRAVRSSLRSVALRATRLRRLLPSLMRIGRSGLRPPVCSQGGGTSSGRQRHARAGRTGRGFSVVDAVPPPPAASCPSGMIPLRGKNLRGIRRRAAEARAEQGGGGPGLRPGPRSPSRICGSEQTPDADAKREREGAAPPERTGGAA